MDWIVVILLIAESTPYLHSLLVKTWAEALHLSENEFMYLSGTSRTDFDTAPGLASIDLIQSYQIIFSPSWVTD
jgi:hypothetical protein